MKYAIVTFGCRVNQADSQVMEDELRARGGIDAPVESADLVIVNTCSVTSSAEQAARQTIRRLARNNPDVRVVVTGCYATREPHALESLPNVRLVVSNHRKETLVNDMDALGVTTAERFGHGDGPCGDAREPGMGGRTALTLRVQTGCDEACSYCIIPRTRGTGRSRPLPAVVADIERAVRAGYKELVITGVHVGSYGRDLGDGTSLDRLIAELARWPDDVLFRLSSLEPMDCSRDLVRQVADSPRLAPHFHLPLQHGSTRVLSAMRRPYSAAFVEDLFGDIHRLMPHAAIGTDMIVGFPGESEEDADATRRLVARLPLSHVHVFPYSDRPGTEASARPDKIDGAVIRRRASALRAVATSVTERFRRRHIGSTRRALTLEGGTYAVTDNYLKVKLPPGSRRNEWVWVTIGGTPDSLIAV